MQVLLRNPLEQHAVGLHLFEVPRVDRGAEAADFRDDDVLVSHHPVVNGARARVVQDVLRVNKVVAKIPVALRTITKILSKIAAYAVQRFMGAFNAVKNRVVFAQQPDH